MPQHTPLHATHVAAGARMVDFAGWDMPVNYGSQIEEHHAVRRDAGMFDVSHMLALDLDGVDAKAFLRGLMPPALRALPGGTHIRRSWLHLQSAKPGFSICGQ